MLLWCRGMRIWVRDRLEIRGKLMEMLQKEKPADAAGLVSCESSLKLVAGVGFEPTTFRL